MILVKLAKYLFTLAVVLANTTLGSWEYSGFNHSSPLFSGKHLCGENPKFVASFEQKRIFSPGAARDHRQSQRCAPAGFYQLSTQLSTEPLQDDEDDQETLT